MKKSNSTRYQEVRIWVTNVPSGSFEANFSGSIRDTRIALTSCSISARRSSKGST